MAVGKIITQENMIDVPLIKPNRFIPLVADEWARRPANKVRPVMIWGAPGIGKTDCVEQLMHELAAKLQKPFKFHPVILSYYNATDLKGIPCPDSEREFTKWLRPDIFNMDDDPNVGNFLFFDEVTNASTSVAQCCYQITQKRRIATHALPDNCYIICAGNRVIDKSGAMKMLKPLANRMRHFEFVPSAKDWKVWAWAQPEFDQRIIGFLNYRPELLFQYDPTSDNVAFPTPRSWAAVSETTYLRNVEDVFEMIAGDIGEATAREFMVYSRLYESLPNIDSIMAGKDVDLPQQPDVMYAMCGALVSKVNELEATEQEKIKNILNYLSRFEKEFQFIAFYDLLKLPNIVPKITKCPEFLQWARAHRDYIM